MRYILFLIMCYPFLFLGAQDADVGNSVSIGVVVPQASEYLTVSQLNRLQTKLKQLITADEKVSAMSNGQFILYPIFEVNHIQQVEGGMKNLVRTEASLSLFIRQMEGHLLVNSVSIELKGTGLSENESLINALLSINPNDALFKQFLAESRMRIVHYYRTHYTAIRNKARTLVGEKRYEEAFALLVSYPEELPEYELMQKDALIYYTEYINVQGSYWLFKAKGLVALNDYEGAVSLLSRIDPFSRSAKEALSVLKSIQHEIDAAEAYEKEILQQSRKAAIDLENRKIDAIKEVAKAYIAEQTKVYYTQVIL